MRKTTQYIKRLKQRLKSTEAELEKLKSNQVSNKEKNNGRTETTNPKDN